MGAKYDEEAGRRATAEGRDLGALESQVQTALYRPERDRSRDNPYKTMEYRADRDGGGAELVHMNAEGASPESAGGEGAAGAGGLGEGQDWGLNGGRSQAEIQDTLKKAQGMYVHGNKMTGGFDASEGCIKHPKEIRDMMFKGETIKVITR